jgi:hypothetical protein
MRIRDIEVRISPVNAGVILIFAIFLIFSFSVSGNQTVLIFGLPMLVFLFLIPLGLNYMSQKEYSDLRPTYESQAHIVRIKAINPNMIGTSVRIVGVVERIYFLYLNRPQFLVGDKSGEISVKMFTSPQEKVVKGDVVEVIGMVMKRYIFTGDPVINCIAIRKIKNDKPARKS